MDLGYSEKDCYNESNNGEREREREGGEKRGKEGGKEGGRERGSVMRKQYCTTRGVIYTCPVRIRAVSIRKEIITFGGPRFVNFVQCIEVARRSGVEHFHLITL